jgi:actin-like ATPase involved in cell morphogenesis
MSAVSVGTSSTAILAADPNQSRRVRIRNTGGTVLHVEIGAAAAVATGYPVAATTGEVVLDLPAGEALNGITITAPIDVRYLVI